VESSDAAAPPIHARRVHFEFDEALPADWHSGNPAITHFFDALSLTFPEGERFFIDSVKHFAPRIEGEALREQVKGFTAQESVHAREHAAYNRLLAARGIPVERFEGLMRAVMRFARKYLSAKAQLALTSGYEHYTALFAEAILGDPRVMEGAHPLYRDLWRWHAMEEEEHKAVAFDVYAQVAPGVTGYLRRAAVMVVGTLDFVIFIPVLQAWLMAHRGQFWNLRAWGSCWYYLWISPGIWRHVIAGVFAYLSPTFHPKRRKLDPRILEWQRKYREQTARTIDGNSLFVDRA